jgi:beta-mannosidase
VKRVDLVDNWQFAEAENWLPAKVPGVIHTDLYKNNRIPDPFYGCNEKDLQWIGEKQWIYKSTIDITPEILSNTNIQLVFEGLDTYAQVILNDSLILHANNMFRQWEVDCKHLLRVGENSIEVRFLPAEEQAIKDSTLVGYPVPGGRWAYIRKAAYHFGWDWGPKYITCGIWKPVYLQLWNDHFPKDIHVVTKKVTAKKADLAVRLSVFSEKTEKIEVQIKDVKNSQILSTQEFDLQKGDNLLSTSFAVEDPKLWWTNGLGEPYLYDLEFLLSAPSGQFSERLLYGIRTIELIQEDDKSGQSMYFKLNGVPVYMKGANYIPQHSFLTELLYDDYRKAIETAAESNMNMLRVWGGGVYQDKVFYELCNKHGILVWQDFMFACSLYPGNDRFVQNVKEEAIHQIKRLRNYSNIALWCGNNEVDEAWHNWGWQRQYKLSKNDQDTIWQTYLDLFRELLPGLVQQYDDKRAYIPTSPMYGWGREASMHAGSAHYWGVWWGMQPFENYLEKVPRFMSEFGFQALPELSTIKSFQQEDEEALISASLKCHEKHPVGFETITAYLEREFLYPKNLEDYIYVSQLLQAHGIGMGIEAQRRAKPYCMGSLYWQLNDCWPVVSWSGMDALGNWKALQYNVKELYKDIMVSVIGKHDTVNFYVVSDRIKDTEGKFEIKIIDFSGQTKMAYDAYIKLPANSSHKVISFPFNDLLHGIDPSQVLLEASFTTIDKQHYSNQKFMVPYGKLNLPKVNISYTIKQAKGGYDIHLNADNFAANVQLFLKDTLAQFDRNFIHLHKGHNEIVYCKSSLDSKSFTEQLHVYHLGKHLNN